MLLTCYSTYELRCTADPHRYTIKHYVHRVVLPQKLALLLWFTAHELTVSHKLGVGGLNLLLPVHTVMFLYVPTVVPEISGQTLPNKIWKNAQNPRTYDSLLACHCASRLSRGKSICFSLDLWFCHPKWCFFLLEFSYKQCIFHRKKNSFKTTGRDRISF